MKKQTQIAVAALAIGTLAITTQANTVVRSGSIYCLSPAEIGNPYGTSTSSTIDLYEISVHSTGNLIIDVLSYEAGEDESFNLVVRDVNQDGEIAYLDTQVMLFLNDGDLTPDDLIDQNDNDYSFPLAGAVDGSFTLQDSYLSLSNIETGEYFLAIGDSGFTANEAITGQHDFGSAPLTTTQADWEQYQQFIHGHGDYQITCKGSAEFTMTPEPGSIALLACAAVGFLRRR